MKFLLPPLKYSIATCKTLIKDVVQRDDWIIFLWRRKLEEHWCLRSCQDTEWPSSCTNKNSPKHKTHGTYKSQKKLTFLSCIRLLARKQFLRDRFFNSSFWHTTICFLTLCDNSVIKPRPSDNWICICIYNLFRRPLLFKSHLRRVWYFEDIFAGNWASYRLGLPKRQGTSTKLCKAFIKMLNL